jgi:predicted Zn-dependent peptidase
MPAPPPIHSIPDLILPAYQQDRLSNGVPVYLSGGSTQDVVKIEFVFMAGKAQEAHHTVAKCTAALLTDGTTNHTSEEIAEHFDFLGAVVSTRGGVDTARIRLFCMNKHLEKALPYLQEVIETPTFPQEEINTYLDNRKERIKIDLTKNETIGYRALTESVFGIEHPYGYNTQIRDLDNVTREMLIDHHRNYYRTDNLMIFVSGKIHDNCFSLLDQYFGQRKTEKQDQKKILLPTPIQKHRVHLAGPQSHQAAIRIGRLLFKRTHADFTGMYVANAVLGGYFGSRLMTKLREEKGFTYGVYSSVDTFMHGGCFYISTEVARKNVQQSLKAIYAEIDRLKTDPIPEKELHMVKNYLMGYLMMQLDGPFNTIDVIKSLLLEAKSTDHFGLLVQKIKDISPTEIQSLIATYLNRNDLIEIVVGIE